MNTFSPVASWAMAFTALLAVFLFIRASANRSATWLLAGWMILQAAISLTGFYADFKNLPPRFLLCIGPPLLFIAVLFISRSGRRYIDTIDHRKLVLVHLVRIPVELVLYMLYTGGAIPEIMTFSGRNFDILSGITALFIYVFGFRETKLSRLFLSAWNVLALGLLVNIVFIAVLSAPFPFQQFGQEQPNFAVFYFPFSWLPGVIVPLVLFAHLVMLRRGWRGDQEDHG